MKSGLFDAYDDTEPWNLDGDDAQDLEAKRRRRLLSAVDELRIREEARGIIAAEKAAARWNPPPLAGLPELIAATEAEVIQWQWEGLAQRGDRLLIEAAAKVGKSTLLGNVVQSLASGSPLLSHFPTTALPDGAVVLYLDTELGPNRLSRWLAEALPTPADRLRVKVWSIAGRAGSLDVRDDATRERMVTYVREHLAGAAIGYLIVDVASAWTAPLGIEENSNTEVRGFLEALHTFTLDLDAAGLALAHHAGHTGERSRGASAYRDWPDVFATLTKGTEEDDKEARYLSAIGRDVEVPESRLTYDPLTRRLSIAGAVGLSRRNAARERVARDYLTTVSSVVAESAGLSTRQLRKAVTEALRAEGVGVKAAAVGEAVSIAESEGLIVNVGSDKRANWAPGIDRDTVGDTPPTTANPRVLPVSLPVSPPVSPSESGHPVSPCPRVSIGDTDTKTHMLEAVDDTADSPPPHGCAGDVCRYPGCNEGVA